MTEMIIILLLCVCVTLKCTGNGPPQVESISNQEEVELRAKIEALGVEVSKLPSKSSQNLNEVVFFFLFMSFFSILHAFLNVLIFGSMMVVLLASFSIFRWK